MTYAEAQEAAKRAGAERPQGLRENIACNLAESQDPTFRWENTPKAQSRLEAWTNAVLNGVPPHQLRQRIG